MEGLWSKSVWIRRGCEVRMRWGALCRYDGCVWYGRDGVCCRCTGAKASHRAPSRASARPAHLFLGLDIRLDKLVHRLSALVRHAAPLLQEHGARGEARRAPLLDAGREGRPLRLEGGEVGAVVRAGRLQVLRALGFCLADAGRHHRQRWRRAGGAFQAEAGEVRGGWRPWTWGPAAIQAGVPAVSGAGGGALSGPLPA